MKKLKRSECSVLPLVLKGLWFDKVVSGDKKEEYRNCTRYWKTRVDNWDRRSSGRRRRLVVEFRLGYAKGSPRAAFQCWEAWPWCIRAVSLYPEWGEPRQRHYVIMLGERVKLED